jgi:hypothetical protein
MPLGPGGSLLGLVAALSIALGALPGCAGSARERLERAERRLRAGRVVDALATYDELATQAKLAPTDRTEALIGAAQACQRLGDPDGARARLERAVTLDVPGAVEPALFYLAERLAATDHARALNLYYRAAAGAEKHRDRRFPYRAAMDRIVQLSITP